MAKKVKRTRLINSLKPVPNIQLYSIQSSALPKIPLTRGSLRKWIFQEDKYTDFAAKDTISSLNYKQIGGYIFKRCDHYIMLRRQINNEIHIPKVSE